MELYLKCVSEEERKRIYCGTLIDNQKVISIDNYICDLNNCLGDIYKVEFEGGRLNKIEIDTGTKVVFDKELFDFYSKTNYKKEDLC